jgi:predicted O-methyltransferase YrrM
MKNTEVVFSESNITLKDNPRSIVMDRASKSLMELYSTIVCQNKGDVLDVGFGMGYSANKMYELADTYTCIEVNKDIYLKALEWAKDKPNVEIIYGDWYDIIPTLDKKFDGIFMDTHYDSNYAKFEEVSKSVAKEGCILSIFNYFVIRSVDEINTLSQELSYKGFSKLVTPTHRVSWSYFNNGEFKKGSYKVKTIQTHLI